MKKLKLRDILVPMVTEHPAVIMVVESDEYSTLRDFMISLLTKLKTKVLSEFSAMSYGEGVYYAYFILVFENEEKMKRGIKECKKAALPFDGLRYEIKEYLRYGDRYIPEWFPDMMLIDDYLAVLRRKRYFSYLDTLLKTMGTGIFPLARRFGERDGGEVAKEHLDALRDLEKNNEVEKLIDFVLRTIYYLRNFPQCEVKKEGEEILIKIIWKEWPTSWFKLGVHFLYGFIMGFLKAFGYEVEEILEEGELKGLKVYKGGIEFKIIVV